MVKSNNGKKFLAFREQFPVFTFKGFDSQFSDKGLRAQFHFALSEKYSFHPTMILPYRDFFITENTKGEVLDNFLFHIGMIEMISYWKAACSPMIRIECGTLDEAQVRWWKNIYFHGLGEFFYLNSIETDITSFVDIVSVPDFSRPPVKLDLLDSALIPIGGGKDSIVTLELLGGNPGNIPMILNPRPASSGTVMKKGYFYDSVVEINRTIDPTLLEMNQQGFLNGHTPFSALLAFTSALAAALTKRKYIALSNESSANESTVRGSDINHQYSKSVDFEGDFRWYLNKYISPDINYFSFLRPLNELQIARLFSGFPGYFPVFRSCNVGSKTDSWCGKCSKCLFTYIILSPFIDPAQMESIFGKNMLNDPDLLPLLHDLTGTSESKPFDCIGTTDEVNAALAALVNRAGDGELPVLLREYRSSEMYKRSMTSSLSSFLDAFNPEHFLPGTYENLLRSSLNERFS